MRSQQQQQQWRRGPLSTSAGPHGSSLSHFEMRDSVSVPCVGWLTTFPRLGPFVSLCAWERDGCSSPAGREKRANQFPACQEKKEGATAFFFKSCFLLKIDPSLSVAFSSYKTIGNASIFIKTLLEVVKFSLFFVLNPIARSKLLVCLPTTGLLAFRLFRPGW